MEAIQGIKEKIRKLRLGEKKEQPALEFDQRALSTIRDIHNLDNPQLHEIPFLGITNKQGVVEEVICSPNFPRQSKLTQKSEYLYSSRVDKKELISLFQQAKKSGKLGRIAFIGHLHPTGEVVRGNTRYTVLESESMLKPSMEDIAFIDSFNKLNPHLKIPHLVITAKTPKGPMLSVYITEQLVKVEKIKHLGKLSSQTIKV